MYIIISTLDGLKLGVLNDFISLSAKKTLSGNGSGRFSIHGSNKSLNALMLNPWLDVQIIYPTGNQTFTIRNGVIKNIKSDKRKNILTFNCIEYIGFLSEKRFLRNNIKLDGDVKTGVDKLFTAFNNIGQLPITLGKNDCTNTLPTKNFEAGGSFSYALKNIVTSGECEFRCVNKTLDVSEKTGNNLPGIYVHNYKETSRSNVVDWGWDIRGEDTYNTRISKNENDTQPIMITTHSSTGNTLLEKFSYDPEGHETLVNTDTIFHPRAVIDAKKEKWRTVEIGDRKKVSLYGEKEYERFNFTGIIQNIEIRLSQGFLNVLIGLSENNDTENTATRSSLSRILEKISKNINVLQTTR